MMKLQLLLLSALPIAAFCFSMQPTQQRSFSVRATPLQVPRAPTTGLSVSTVQANGDNDAILRDFERKEQKILKQREKAESKLTAAEEAIQLLQSQKQEYLNGLQLAKSPPGGNFKETTMRSVVKSLMWRVVAGSVTFVTSYQFSGSLTTALSIVGSDFFSKAFTMFIGERIMNKSSAGRKKGNDGVGRSLAKALIWRAFAIVNTLTVAIFFAKDISMASKIAGSDAIFKTALMFFYERVWAKVPWGKEYQIEFSI